MTFNELECVAHQVNNLWWPHWNFNFYDNTSCLKADLYKLYPCTTTLAILVIISLTTLAKHFVKYAGISQFNKSILIAFSRLLQPTLFFRVLQRTICHTWRLWRRPFIRSTMSFSFIGSVESHPRADTLLITQATSFISGLILLTQSKHHVVCAVLCY